MSPTSIRRRCFLKAEIYHVGIARRLAGPCNDWWGRWRTVFAWRIVEARSLRLSRTYKDELSKKTSRIVLEVLQNRDGTYEVFWKGERVRSRVPERWLSAE